MNRVLLGVLLTFLSSEVMGQSWRKQCTEVYGHKNYCDDKDELDNFKKYGAEIIKRCLETYNDSEDCYYGSDLARFKKDGAEVVKSCIKIYGNHKNCNDDSELASFKKFGAKIIKGCIETYRYSEYCDDDVELARFKKYGAEAIKGCLDIYIYNNVFCDDDVELAIFKKYGAEVIKRCLLRRGYSNSCGEDVELDLFKKYSEEVIRGCETFHGNDSSMCDTGEQLSGYAEIAPYIEPCRAALGNACTDCSSIEGVKRFMRGQIAKESIGPNYFNIAKFFDIAIEPACAAYQLELRPQYEKYVKKVEKDLNSLVQCEVQSTKNNLMVKELQKFSDKMISDIKYMSLFKASLTNEKIKNAFLDFVKDFAKKNKLSDKAQIGDTGISYADDEVEIGLSFKDTVDKENNKQSVLQLKSLQCEKKYPPQKMLSYEDYRNKEVPHDCLKFKLKEGKIGASPEVDKVKDKTEKIEGKKSQTTTL